MGRRSRADGASAHFPLRSRREAVAWPANWRALGQGEVYSPLPQGDAGEVVVSGGGGEGAGIFASAVGDDDGPGSRVFEGAGRNMARHQVGWTYEEDLVGTACQGRGKGECASRRWGHER